MRHVLAADKSGSTTANRLIIISAALVVAILVQEFAVRLALPAYDPSGHVRFVEESRNMPQRGEANVVRRLTKNTGEFDVAVRFNRHGMRDAKDFAASRSEDLFVVGDSFAFGWGVEENQRLSEKLEAALGRKIYTLASGGGDLDNYDLLLEYATRRGATIGQIVVAVNVGTDMRVYGDRPQPAPAAGQKPAPGAINFIAAKAILMRNSALYFMTTSIVHGNATLRSLGVKAGLIAPTRKGGALKGYDRAAIVSSAQRIAALTSKYKGVALIIPPLGVWAGKAENPARRMTDELIGELRRLKVNLLNLRPAFERDGDPASLHFKTDAHWNPKGHARAAEALAEYFKARGGNS